MEISTANRRTLAAIRLPIVGRLLLASLLGSGACGPAGPTLVPVTGTVTLEGKPVREVIVNFAPIGTTLGSGAMGATNDQGEFSLTDVRGKPGAHVGEYKVHLYPSPQGRAGGLPANVVSLGGGSVPAIYIDPNYTPLQATVPAEGGNVQITLTPNGKGAGTTTHPHAVSP